MNLITTNRLLAVGISLLLSSGTIFANGITGLDVDAKRFSELHQSGFALQISDTTDLAYYTENHEYTVGIGNIGYSNTNSGSDTTFRPSLFGRRNFALTAETIVGFGGSIGTHMGQIGGKNITDGFRFAPYTFFEYAANKNILIGASVRLFDYRIYSVEGKPTQSTTYLSASTVQLAVKF